MEKKILLKDFDQPGYNPSSLMNSINRNSYYIIDISDDGKTLNLMHDQIKTNHNIMINENEIRIMANDGVTQDEQKLLDEMVENIQSQINTKLELINTENEIVSNLAGFDKKLYESLSDLIQDTIYENPNLNGSNEKLKTQEYDFKDKESGEVVYNVKLNYKKDLKSNREIPEITLTAGRENGNISKMFEITDELQDQLINHKFYDTSIYKEALLLSDSAIDTKSDFVYNLANEQYKKKVNDYFHNRISVPKYAEGLIKATLNSKRKTITNPEEMRKIYLTVFKKNADIKNLNELDSASLKGLTKEVDEWIKEVNKLYPENIKTKKINPNSLESIYRVNGEEVHLNKDNIKNDQTKEMDKWLHSTINKQDVKLNKIKNENEKLKNKILTLTNVYHDKNILLDGVNIDTELAKKILNENSRLNQNYRQALKDSLFNKDQDPKELLNSKMQLAIFQDDLYKHTSHGLYCIYKIDQLIENTINCMNKLYYNSKNGIIDAVENSVLLNNIKKAPEKINAYFKQLRMTIVQTHNDIKTYGQNGLNTALLPIINTYNDIKNMSDSLNNKVIDFLKESRVLSDPEIAKIDNLAKVLYEKQVDYIITNKNSKINDGNIKSWDEIKLHQFNPEVKEYFQMAEYLIDSRKAIIDSEIPMHRDEIMNTIAEGLFYVHQNNQIELNESINNQSDIMLENEFVDLNEKKKGLYMALADEFISNDEKINEYIKQSEMTINHENDKDREVENDNIEH